MDPVKSIFCWCMRRQKIPLFFKDSPTVTATPYTKNPPKTCLEGRLVGRFPWCERDGFVVAFVAATQRWVKAAQSLTSGRESRPETDTPLNFVAPLNRGHAHGVKQLTPISGFLLLHPSCIQVPQHAHHVRRSK
jgi:hypothetical protein